MALLLLVTILMVLDSNNDYNNDCNTDNNNNNDGDEAITLSVFILLLNVDSYYRYHQPLQQLYLSCTYARLDSSPSISH